MISLKLVSKGSNFIFYLDGYLNQSNEIQSMLLGTFLCLCICIILCVFLYLSSQWLGQLFGTCATWFLVHIYVTGQLVNTLPLLVQVDLIDASITAWSSQHFISNEFELGHFFKVLFGYQASPSIAQVAVYAVALFTPLVIFYWLKLSSASHLGTKQ
jgi:high-affinity iron transporter